MVLSNTKIILQKLRYLPVFVFAFGLFVTFALSTISKSGSEQQYISKLNFEMNSYLALIERKGLDQIHALETLANFFSATEDVKPDEFTHYTNELLLEYPGIAAFSWIEITDADTVMALDIHDAHIDTQGNIDDDIHRRMKQYFPVRMLNSRTSLESRESFDAVILHKKYSAIVRALNTREPVATVNIPLDASPNAGRGIVVYDAVYDAAGKPKGLAVISLKTGYVVAAALGTNLDHISMQVDDVTDHPELINLIEPTRPDWYNLERLSYSRVMTMAQRQWQFTLSPHTDFVQTQKPGLPWGVILIGLIATLTITYMTRAQLRKQATIEKLVDARTSELQNSMNELLKANEDLERFAYVASHDLRSPLRAVDNLVSWISEDLGDSLDADNAERMGMVRLRVSRMERLLNDLLTYARADKVFTDNGTKIELYELVTQISEILDVPKDFKIEVSNGLKGVFVSRMPLKQVLQNLIQNAVKHHDKEEGLIRIYCVDANKYHHIMVEDDGPGIDPAFHDKIFEMFQTLKRRDDVDGSGMGLAIVNKLVRRSGGEIRLTSQEGEGSRFTIVWPKSDWDTPS